MNSVNSIINQFRTFPEYHQVVQATETLNKNSKEIYDGYSKAYGPDFTTFRKTQPDQLKPILEKLNQTGLNEVKIHHELNISLDQMPHKLPQLKTLQENLLAEFNAKNDKVEAETKARNNLTKAEAKLSQLQAKGKQADIYKQEAVVNQLRSALEKAEEESRTASAHFSEIEFENSKKFPCTWIDQILDSTKAMKEASQKYQQAGQEIYEASQEIVQFEDPAIPTLRKRLQQWEETQI